MKFPLWAIAIVVLCIIVVVYRESKKRDILNSDDAQKVQSFLTDNPFSKFVSQVRG